MMKFRKKKYIKKNNLTLIILKLLYKIADATGNLKGKLLAVYSNMYRRWVIILNLVSYAIRMMDKLFNFKL